MIERDITGGYPIGQPLVVCETETDGRIEPMVVAFFIDAAIDVFRVRYDMERGAIIETGGRPNLTLLRVQLEAIASSIAEAEALHAKLSVFYDDETDTWNGYEHLVHQPQPAEF